MIDRAEHLTRAELIQVQRPDKCWQAGLARCDLTLESLAGRVDRFLHPRERERFAQLKFPKRQQSYLAGRHAAKAALGCILPGVNPCDIWVDSGVFDFPVVRLTSDAAVQVSISHAGDSGWALASDAAHPFGLDVEAMRTDREEVISKQLTEREKGLLSTLPTSSLITRFLAWTMKEALSKAIKSGLMTPFEVYGIEEIQYHDGLVTGRFTNFAQYKSISFVSGVLVCSIVLPKKSEMTIPPAFFLDPHES